MSCWHVKVKLIYLQFLNFFLDDKNLRTWMKDQWNTQYDASFVQSDILAPIIRYCCTTPQLCIRTRSPLSSGIVVTTCAVWSAFPYHQVLLYDSSTVHSDPLAPIIRYCCHHLCIQICFPLSSGIVVRICAIGPAFPYHQVLLSAFVQSDPLSPIIRYCQH